MYQYQVKEMAKELFAKHGLDKQGWRLEFDTAKRRNGVCRYATKTIGISLHYMKLNTPELVRDTLLHEIAHALTPRDAGHGRQWKQMCAEIGAMPVAVKQGMNIQQVHGKWQATCPGCNKIRSRHRQPQRGARYSCPDCSNRFNPEFELIFKKEG